MTEVRVETIPTTPSMGRVLIEHDPASRAYGVRGVVAREGVERKTRTWRRSYQAQDQGQTSSCVGQTFEGILNTVPLRGVIPLATRKHNDYEALTIYREAQRRDYWPGEEPTYYGTSALGALKYLRERGVIQAYRWCFGVDDVLDTLSQYGPVGIGIWWYSGMFNTDSSGFIHPTGSQEGGHEVELHGLDVRGKYVIGTNSWGTGWGVNGRFKLSWEDLDRLLQEDGDAATITAA